MGRIVYGSAGGRDMVSLKNAMDHLPAIASSWPPSRADTCGSWSHGWTAGGSGRGHRQDLAGRSPLRRGRVSSSGTALTRKWTGCVASSRRQGHHRLHGAAEKEKTGIRTLKIGYNKVFGYYIEVSNSFKELVPETYIRKQTLVNGERYITQELKDLEHDILSASDRDAALEYELFTRLRQTLCDAVTRVQGAAAVVAELDCLCSLAAVAVKNNYCCPVVDESGVIEIHDGRHPVVEQMLKGSLFVPNDTRLNCTTDRCLIITGPNMAGKSTYMRQMLLSL